MPGASEDRSMPVTKKGLPQAEPAVRRRLAVTLLPTLRHALVDATAADERDWMRLEHAAPCRHIETSKAERCGGRSH